jgi:hypothetical protein
VSALEFLDACPGAIDAQFTAVLDAVVAAPPPRFSGGVDGRSCRVDGRLVREIRLTGSGRRWQVHIPQNRGEPPVPAGT